ncbi:MAG: hypothetical protein AAGF14_01000 [Pseudomonadota bacterium]
MAAATPQYANIADALKREGLSARGGFTTGSADAETEHAQFPDGSGRIARTIIMVGVLGRQLWPALQADPDFMAGWKRGDVNPLDDWSERVIGSLAAQWNAGAVFPNDQPYRPFQRWAQRAETLFPSPIGMLIHPEFGLWHAYRGALLFEDALDLPARPEQPSPCETCADKPCLSACPVNAFTETHDPMKRYDVAACAGHLATEEGQSCLTGGCAARDACPVGREHRYEPDQMRFHMAAFARARGVEVAS